MKKIYTVLQFFPLSIFLLVARSHHFTGNAWHYAFQMGAIVALIETGILFVLVGHQLNRLMMGVNLFLVIGGIGMVFNLTPLQNFMGLLNESGLIFFVGVVCALATLFTKSGVFENSFSKINLERKYSLYFLAGLMVVFAWSYFNRGNTLMAGVIPFISLVVLKQILQKKLQRN